MTNYEKIKFLHKLKESEMSELSGESTSSGWVDTGTTKKNDICLQVYGKWQRNLTVDNCADELW